MEREMKRKMAEDKKIILFGAGIVGLKALHYYGAKNVYCFTDNYKCGQLLRGKKIVSFEELQRIHQDYRVIISVTYESAPSLRAQCAAADIKADVWGDIATIENFICDPKIAAYKGIHSGKRCFLIGNGPSLRADDLDTLYEHGEQSFGCNAIFNVFHMTEWRPNYYCVVDISFFHKEHYGISKVEAEALFVPRMEYTIKDITAIMESLAGAKGKVLQCNLISFSDRPDFDRWFSEDPSKAFYPAGSVMHIMIQLAKYMGFERIYLLGVDGTAVTGIDRDGSKSVRHFYAEREGEAKEKYAGITCDVTPETLEEYTMRGYEAAEKYSREHGFRIYNATRGGVLEMFERVDFDSLF